MLEDEAKDLSLYGSIEFDLYIPQSYSGSRITLGFDSPKPAGSSDRSFIKHIDLDWQGWKHFSIPLYSSVFDVASGDFSQILRVFFTGRGWGYNGNEEVEVYIGKVWLEPASGEVIDETKIYLGPDNAWKSKRFTGKDAKSIYTENVENTITLLENSQRVFVNGEKFEMEAKAVWKDEKLYMPKSAFTDILNLSASVTSITVGGIEYVPAAEALKAAGKDVYEYKRFVIAGQDVSAFREDYLATEYAAYVNGYVDITEMTWTQEDFDEILERVEASLVFDED